MRDHEIIISILLNSENIRVGTLWFNVRGRKESASFEYDKTWLSHPEKFALEPALTLSEGVFHTHNDASLFGAIGDSAPDRWGRVLMRRAEILRAKKNKTAPSTLFESDYLLGVNDETRQGALRFSMSSQPTVFLSEKQRNTVPALVELSKLLLATERFNEQDESAEDLQLLLAPGSSLGGARPKASVRDKDGTLLIAKFPRKDDELNVVTWEAIALALAKKAKIIVPDWRLEKISKKPVLIVKRFDRRRIERIPYLSAMSMLAAKDNQQHSYLEMVDALTQYGAQPKLDMAQLWRRIIFTIMISNTDDHLRNHGFVYERNQGWRLSPAFDLNPTPLEIKPHILSTAIDLHDTTASIETALSVAVEFRLSKQEALQIINEVRTAVKQWRSVARKFGCSKKECDQMASAFVTSEK